MIAVLKCSTSVVVSEIFCHIRGQNIFLGKTFASLRNLLNIVAFVMASSFLPELIIGTSKVVLTFKSVNEFLWCDHSNETFFGSTFTWYYLFFNILQNEISLLVQTFKR